MDSPVLVTKLFIPRIHQDLVNRHSLIDRLNDGVHRKVTLVSAPAGFGKSTMVSEWVTCLDGEHKACWYALDSADNDPVRFMLYFVSAIQTILPDFGNGLVTALQSSHPPSPADVLTILINHLATLPDAIVLILDDYHLIEIKEIHDGLTFLIDNMPPNLHIVLITREDPPLPLARLRVRRNLSELRAADLRFNNEETIQFLNKVMQLDLTDQEVTALETRTEGWIAGLQLAAISLRGQENTSKLIQSFTGSNRLVLDYLIEEVLNQQPEEIQDFLFRTSILNRFCGSLCDAVGFSPNTNSHNSGQVVLELLERTNLFLIPLDDQRQWFRYHHLFADLLQQKLNQFNSELIDDLHHQASQWFEQNGYVDESIEHSFAAKDSGRAATLIDNQADKIWGRGEHYRLWPWLFNLPPEDLRKKPRLCILHAWHLFSVGKWEESQNYLKVAEEELNRLKSLSESIELSTKDSISMADIRMLQGRLASLQALEDSWWEDVPQMLFHAKEALDLLPSGDPWFGPAITALGDAYYYEGDIELAQQTRLEGVAACEQVGDTFWYIISRLKVVCTLRHLAKLKEAIEDCEQLCDSIQQSGLIQAISLGWLYALWGDSLNETIEIEKAHPILVKSEELTRGKDHAFFAYSEMCLIRHYFYKNNFALAKKHLQVLQNVGEEHYIPANAGSALIYWQTRLFLVQQQPEMALDYAEQKKLTAISEGSSLYQIIALARIYLAQRRFEEASDVLLEGITIAKNLKYAAREIELQILFALMNQEFGQPEKAMKALSRALFLAESSEYIWLFVNEGPAMAQLLLETYQRGIHPEYIQRLLAAFPVVEAEDSTLLKTANVLSELIEPLSERELEVLQLLSDGMSNQEIAQQLYLSLNTVKAHTRNIYGKLNVNNRTQAAAKARGLGLVVGY